VYARACIILLAVNFCLTGYVLTGVLKIQNVQEVDFSRATPPPITLPSNLPAEIEAWENLPPKEPKTLFHSQVPADDKE